MANRKQELDAAVASSKQEAAERTAAMKPQQATSSEVNPGFKLPYTKQQEAAAAAPMHPRAAKSRASRQKELNTGMEAGRGKLGRLMQEGQRKIDAGEGTVTHEYRTVLRPKSTTKKRNTRQVKGATKGSSPINSGDVSFDTDYGELVKSKVPVAVTQNDLKERAAKAEAKTKEDNRGRSPDVSAASKVVKKTKNRGTTSVPASSGKFLPNKRRSK